MEAKYGELLVSFDVQQSAKLFIMMNDAFVFWIIELMLFDIHDDKVCDLNTRHTSTVRNSKEVAESIAHSHGYAEY